MNLSKFIKKFIVNVMTMKPKINVLNIQNKAVNLREENVYNSEYETGN